MVVEQPLLVLPDLDRWVEDRPEPPSDERLDAPIRVGGSGFAPLLQLDDDGVLSGVVVAGEECVEAPTRVPELVFENHPVVIQIGLIDEEGKSGQRVLPGDDLAWSRLVPDLRDVFDGQLLCDPMRPRIGHELLGRRRIKLH